MTLQFPIFYSPIYNSDFDSDKTPKNGQSKLIHSSNFHEQKVSDLSSYITTTSPTYLFNPDDITEDKSFYLSDVPFDSQTEPNSSENSNELRSKIELVSDLFLYPELSLSKSLYFNQSVSKLSHLSNIPQVNDNDKIHCICHKTSKIATVKCAICNNWSHLRCYNIAEDRIPDVFICLYCQYDLASSLKQQIREILTPIKQRLINHCHAIAPIEKTASKCTLDKLIQINGIPQFKRICSDMNEYSQNSRSIWNELCEVKEQIQKALNECVWEKDEDDDETYDEGEENSETQKSEYSD